jgi:hypothetical protein
VTAERRQRSLTGYGPSLLFAHRHAIEAFEVLGLMRSKVYMKACQVSAVLILAGCVSANDGKILYAVKSLEGQKREKVVAAFGSPSHTTIENGATISYWPMTEIEQ